MEQEAHDLRAAMARSMHEAEGNQQPLHEHALEELQARYCASVLLQQVGCGTCYVRLAACEHQPGSVPLERCAACKWPV